MQRLNNLGDLGGIGELGNDIEWIAETKSSTMLTIEVNNALPSSINWWTFQQ
jgi:hypothetical protein